MALPKVDGEEVSFDRLTQMLQADLDAPITGYPDVSEQGNLERHNADLEDEGDDFFAFNPDY